MRMPTIVQLLSTLALAAACSVPVGAERFGPASEVDRSAAPGFASEPGGLSDDGNGADFKAASPKPSGGFDAFTVGSRQLPADSGTVAGEAPAAQERMLIYRGTMSVEVARVDDAVAEFLAKVKGFGGYLSSQRGGQLTARVPAAQFEATFAALRAMGRVLDESREANDVTEQYLDVGIRLENARKSRDRLLELLEKAQKVEDMLKIEEQLRRLTEEIERMEGQRKFLADQVAMATVTAAFTAVAEAAPVRAVARPSQFPWIRELGAEQVLGR